MLTTSPPKLPNIQAIRTMVGKLASGEPVLYKPPMFSQSFVLNPIGQRGSGLIVLAKEAFSGRENPFRLLYYRKLEDLELFTRSSESLRDGGPADSFPGSVGTSSCVLLSKPVKSTKNQTISHKTNLYLYYIQGCFKIGSPPELDDDKARIYGGWRVRLLQYLFEIAQHYTVTMVTLQNFNVAGRGFPPDFEKFFRFHNCSFDISSSPRLLEGEENVYVRKEVALLP